MNVSHFLLWVVFLSISFSLPGTAQQLPNNGQATLDSLYKEFRLAKNDTTKVRLRALIGSIPYPKSSETFWDSIVSDARLFGASRIEAIGLINLANCYYAKIEMTKARSCLNRSILICEKHGYKSIMLKALVLISRINYGYFLDVNEGLNNCYRGIRIAEEIGDNDMAAKFKASLGLMYFLSGEISKALNCHLSALNIVKHSNDARQTASLLCDVASDYMQLRDTENTIRYYMATLKYLSRSKNTYDDGEIYKAVASAYVLKSQPDSAVFYCNKAIDVFKGIQNNSGVAGSLSVMANISFRRGQNKKAVEQALECIKLCKSIGFTIQIPYIATLLKEIYLKDKNYKGALEAYELCRVTEDSISNEKGRKLALQKEFNYQFEKKESENKLLVSQNQVQSLELSRKNVFIFGLIALIFLILVIVYLFYQQNKIKQRQQRMEFTQKLLRSQINPHFMSNCLSAVQNLILEKESDKAADYLAKFSSFLRQILNTSEKYYLSLAEEIETINLYIELEQLRFKNNFTFRLNIQNDIPLNDLIVPSFITQPFIENAIWHALLPLSGRSAVLSLDIKMENDLIFLIIEDNGVGRRESGERASKKSKGTKLIFENIKNLNQLLKSADNKIEIVDLKNEHGQAIGTRIIIQLSKYTLD